MGIGEDIKSLRKQRGLTQKQLGELCGIAESNIRKYENGKQNPKQETIHKIATVLNAYTFYDGVTHQSLLVPLQNNQFPIDSYTNIIQRIKNGEQLTPMDQFIVETLEFDYRESEQKYSKDLNRLTHVYSILNKSGQKRVIEHAEMIAKIPEYQKKSQQEEAPSSQISSDVPDDTPQD